jgi:hypothetical protein
MTRRVTWNNQPKNTSISIQAQLSDDVAAADDGHQECWIRQTKKKVWYEQASSTCNQQEHVEQNVRPGRSVFPFILNFFPFILNVYFVTQGPTFAFQTKNYPCSLSKVIQTSSVVILMTTRCLITTVYLCNSWQSMLVHMYHRLQIWLYDRPTVLFCEHQLLAREYNKSQKVWGLKFQEFVCDSNINLPLYCKPKMAQQGKQMRVGGCNRFKYHSVKLVLLA